MSCQFLNPKGAVPPHRNLYKNVSISPAGSKMCYVATQYSADEDGNILHPGNYQQQSKVVWTNISKILEGIGAKLEHVVLKTVTYADFNEEIGKAVTVGMMESFPDEKDHWHSAPCRFIKSAGFHEPGVVFTVDLVVAISDN